MKGVGSRDFPFPLEWEDDPLLHFEGDIWRIIGMGVSRAGKTFCHLSSTTRGWRKPGGWYPVGICDWVDHEAIQSALMQREERRRARL